MDEVQLKQLSEFKARTEAEREAIAARLLSPLDEVYEIDFGPIMGKLNFRRMNLEDRVRLAESAKDEGRSEEVAAELLEKYSADGIKKQTWLDMVRKDPDPSRINITGERAPEFVKIVMNLTALSVGGSEDGMMQFFRALENRLSIRGSLPVLTQDTAGTNENGTG